LCAGYLRRVVSEKIRELSNQCNEDESA